MVIAHPILDGQYWGNGGDNHTDHQDPKQRVPNVNMLRKNKNSWADSCKV